MPTHIPKEQSNIQEVMAEFDKRIEENIYTQYKDTWLGCCGGDYCTGNHNQVTREWFTSKLHEVYQQGRKDGIEDMLKLCDECARPLWNEFCLYCKGFEDGVEEGLKISNRLEQSKK